MDREVWQITAHRVTKSQTWLRNQAHTTAQKVNSNVHEQMKRHIKQCIFIYWPACTRAQLLRCVQLFVTPWTAARQAPLSTQVYWSGLLLPPPGDLPDQGIKLISPVSPTLAGGFFTTGILLSSKKELKYWYMLQNGWILIYYAMRNKLFTTDCIFLYKMTAVGKSME